MENHKGLDVCIELTNLIEDHCKEPIKNKKENLERIMSYTQDLKTILKSERLLADWL